jgi:hypothetical protein
MNKAKQNEPRGLNIYELQAPDLAIWSVEKVVFFHQHKMKIQYHDVVPLVLMNPTSLRTPQSEFL